MEFDENTILNLVLTVSETNVILTHLSKGTFESVAPVIGKIRDQAEKQAQQKPASETKTEATLSDGENFGGND